MNIKSLVCLSLLAVGCAGPMWADGGVAAGDCPGYSRSWKNAVLLHTCEKYADAVRSLKRVKARTDMDAEAVEWSEQRVTELRGKVLDLLQEYPEQVNDVLYDHGIAGSPLFFAVWADDAEMVQMMLDKGAIPFLTQFPAECSYEDMLTGAGGWFSQNKSAPSPEVVGLINKARAKYNVLESLLLARRMGVTIDKPYRPSVKSAGNPPQPAPVVKDGYPDDSTLCQQYGPYPDRSPRYISCRGHMCLMPWNFGQTGNCFLHACTRGSDCSRMEDGHPYYSPLIFAMLDDERLNHPQRGHIYGGPYIQGLTSDKARELVLQLIEENKDDCVNDCYNNFVSPLTIAVRNNDLGLVRLLLRKGADPHRTSARGNYLVHEAAGFGNVEMVKLLLRRGANPLSEDGRPSRYPAYDETENDPAKLKCRILILEAQTRLLAP